MSFSIHLLLILFARSSLCIYDSMDVAAGVKMSANEQMLVSVSNAFSNFAVLMNPFRHSGAGDPTRCSMRYETTDRFVHTVAVVGLINATVNEETFAFVFAAENMTSAVPYVCVATISIFNCTSKSVCRDLTPTRAHQEFFLLGVDANGTYAYGFTSSFVFQLEIRTANISRFLDSETIWPSRSFIPHAMDFADSWVFVVGYGYPDILKNNYGVLGCRVDLVSLSNASCVSIVSEVSYLVPSELLTYSKLHEMSVAIRAGKKILVGIHRLNSVIMLEEDNNDTINVTGIYTVTYDEYFSFGRVVDWADDETIAVLAHRGTPSAWSTSEIFFYDQKSISTTTPLFVFPNHQQILGTRLHMPYFARFIITTNGNMGILTDLADVLIVPIVSPGQASVWIDPGIRAFVFYYQPKPCIGGTFKNKSSLGPCQICPPQTRNPGGSSALGLTCTACSNKSRSFCPLGSLVDIDMSTMPSSYTQAMSYPESPEMTDFEDILLQNVFQIDSRSSCLVISPLFWTFIVGGLCLLVRLTMFLMKRCNSKRWGKGRQYAKRLFKHTDIIGEGELLAGGLATFAIVVLAAFAYWFAISFIQQYPIENHSGNADFACDKSLANAKFSTRLELLSLPKTSESQLMFKLLDEQRFQLTLEFINTGFTCGNITAQQNLFGRNFLRLPTQCSNSPSNAITSVSFALPNHYATVQVNLTGPYWFGAFRLCMFGVGQTMENYKLKELNFCQLFTAKDQVIGRLTEIPIAFVKNINMTKGLNSHDSTQYSGLWIPSFPNITLSDDDYYAEFGNYRRYTSSLTVIEVILNEREFYIKNIQEPIVRTAQLIFNALLFTSLCIELFALSFLFTKLFIVPLFRLIGNVWKNYHHPEENTKNKTPPVTETL